MKLGSVLSVIALSTFAASPLAAYETLAEDYATCTQGQGKVDKTVVVAACTRLIDNAQAENETIGMIYAMRATANDDAQSNCSDAKKVLELVDDPTFVEGAKTLIKLNC